MEDGFFVLITGVCVGIGVAVGVEVGVGVGVGVEVGVGVGVGVGGGIFCSPGEGFSFSTENSPPVRNPSKT